MHDRGGNALEPWRGPLNGRRTDLQDPDAGYGPAGFSFRETLATIWRFRAIVALAVVVALGIGYYQSMVQETQYRSAALISISADQGAPLGGLSGGVARMLGGSASGGLRSHIEMMRSMTVLTEVVDETGLRLMEIKDGLLFDEVHPTVLVKEPQVVQEPGFDRLELTFGEDGATVRAGQEERQVGYGEFVEMGGVSFRMGERPDVDEATIYVMSRFAAAEYLARSLQIGIRTDTNVLDVAYSTYDPLVAQRVVNSTVESFRRFDNRRKQEEARARRTFLSEQIAYTDSLLAESQQALIGFQQRVQSQSARERFAAEQSGLIDLERRRIEMQSERALYQSLLSQLEGPSGQGEDRIRALASAPLTMENPILESLVERLMDYERQRDALTAGRWASAQSNPEVARLDTLITATEDRMEQAVQSLVAGLDARIGALDQLHSRSVASIQGLPAADAEEIRLEYQIESIADVLGFLQEEYHMARVEEAVGSGQVEVIDMARAGDPFGADPRRTLGFALIFGLMLGSAGALLAGNLSSSIRQREDVEQVLHLNQLAVIPALDTHRVGRFLRKPANGNGHIPASVPATEYQLVAAGQSVGAEAFRALRMNLIIGNELGARRTIAVTSAGPGEGRTTTVANLGLALAQQGMRVLLVDCDLRRPQLHRIFGVARERGLGDLLTGKVLAEETVRSTESPGVSVVPAGEFSVQALHLIGTVRMEEAIERLSAGFDVVLLDTPPLQVTVDGAAIAAFADAAVFLVRARKTDRRAAQAALQQLASVGANVVGGVLNDPDERIVVPKEYRVSPISQG